MKTYLQMDGDKLVEYVEKREYDLLALALQNAVKRMESVPIHDLKVAFREAGTKYNFQCDAIEAVRNRLIQAAKGERP